MSRLPNGVSIVVPTIGRPSLGTLIASLGDLTAAPVPVELLTVDGRGRGPAAARNAGWRAARHEWVAFLDDDVVAGPDWLLRLVDDLTVDGTVGGVQGRVMVPLPAGRRPTDWERVTAGLAGGAWITADMAYRREALVGAGGFDERFPRAFREDAELALRVHAAGWRLLRGGRAVTHPVRPEGPWVSVRTQRGNADDALLRHLYGRRWRSLLGVPPGRRRRHAAVTAAGLAAIGLSGVAAATGGRGARAGALAAGLVWAAGTARFAAARILPGPRTLREVATMTVTSVAIPPVAVAAWCRGWLRGRGALPLPVTPRPSIADPATITRRSQGSTAEPGRHEADTIAEPGRPGADTASEPGRSELDTVAESGRPGAGTASRPGWSGVDTVTGSGRSGAGITAEHGPSEVDTRADAGRSEVDAGSAGRASRVDAGPGAGARPGGPAAPAGHGADGRPSDASAAAFAAGPARGGVAR
ncbi:glycosyltransferase family 2 protein [Dactylosporangium sp. NPDC000521]|uniref:glycosyltransferase family 2 protein n=1 Tax=Dactylosporangium sp. NPDC000521 TaxID=3363975 RepID=UPI0036B15607